MYHTLINLIRSNIKLTIMIWKAGIIEGICNAIGNISLLTICPRKVRLAIRPWKLVILQIRSIELKARLIDERNQCNCLIGKVLRIMMMR